ncbi:type II toxin-antitoxin system Phd/YefM family antitoxin [Azospirillum sp. sgz301742]
MERTITASEFQATMLDVLGQLAGHTLNRVVITDDGRPVAVLTPPAATREEAEGLFGCLADQTVIPEGYDLTEPVIDELPSTAYGRLHE